MRFSLVAAAAFAVSVVAAPASHPRSLPHVLHERREYDHPAWIYRRSVPVGTKLPVRIGMTQSNLDKAHDLLMEVSHHESPKYGQHYTAEEVIDLFAPAKDTVEAIFEWVASAGIRGYSQSANKQWVQFDAAVEELEDLLKTTYHEYEHGDTGVVNVACDEYHVPAHIQEHIDYITPGIKMMTTAKQHVDPEVRKAKRHLKKTTMHGPIPIRNVSSVAVKAVANDLSQCGAIITPECIYAMYNITAGTTSVPGNTLGIFEDIEQWYDQADMNDFFLTIAPQIPRGTHPICKGIDGAVCPTPIGYPGAEALLDLTAAYPIIYPQQISMFQTDDTPTELYYYYSGFFNNFFDGIDGSYCTYSAYGETGNSPIDPMYPNNATGGYNHTLQCGVYKPTNVISISYATVEGDPSIPVAYQRRQCNEILKLGLQGTSVVVSSGDSGVGSYEGCFGSYYDPVFAPGFPAACPYASTLGSTQLLPGKSAAKDQEVATEYETAFSSGGGFSNIFPSPSYQKKALNNYFNKYPPSYPYYETVNNQSVGANYGMYNRIGRGFPDFAAIGWNYALIYYGYTELFGGTSLSAPVFASILTRINEARLMAGKSTVGFVNPVLYKNPHVFHDITVGSNPACNTDGFSCNPGWDPVTGLGTPKFYQMMELFMSLD